MSKIKPKLAGSSIQKGWFLKHLKHPVDTSVVITKDLDAYQDLSFCIRDLKLVSASNDDFFLILNVGQVKINEANKRSKTVKDSEPLIVTSTKIGKIILGLINSSIYESASWFSNFWQGDATNYRLHPVIDLFLMYFPKDISIWFLAWNADKFYVDDFSQIENFNKRCQNFRDELKSSKFKLRCRGFERNSQESKLKLKKAFARLLSKKKRVYVLRLDLDSRSHLSIDFSLNPLQHTSLKSLPQPPFYTSSSELKRDWETLSRWIRRSKGIPQLFGHASRLHCFPSVGCKLHVILIFEWMTHTHGCQVRDSIVDHWENRVTAGRGVADSKNSLALVSSFPGCGALSAKNDCRLEEIYEQAIPYLTDMDLHMGRIAKCRNFSMWHLK